MLKKRLAARVRCVSPGERVRTEDPRWKGFVKEVGFELGVKELWMMRVVNLWKKLNYVGRSEEMERPARGCRREAGS